MPAWMFPPAILGLLAVAIAQWLDWQSGIQERRLDCHFRKRGA